MSIRTACNAHTLALIVCVSAILWLAFEAGPAEARQWRPTPQALAQEYAMIQDNRPGGELVMVLWVPPEMMEDKSAQGVLASDVLVGVIDANVAPNGTMMFAPVETLNATDSRGTPLHALKSEDIPPAVAGVLTSIQSLFRQSLGPVGQGFHWFVFDGATVHSCVANSGFTIQLAGENYLYATPIPGCPKT
jgi:hypothetical protein